MGDEMTINSGNNLLLRLFRSQYFNSWIALSYLFKYPDAVGIQHYLCNELKRFPLSEIEFFLPQLCHLLISRPSESVALENFILDRCQISSHMAILTLWYLQAYTSDLATTPNSPSFKLCKRVFNKCQAIVFAAEAPGEYEDIFGKNGVPKVKENALSAMVGMGVMLAAFGQPLMTKSPGQLALAQGRRPRAFSQAGVTDKLEEIPTLEQIEEGSKSPKSPTAATTLESGSVTPGRNQSIAAAGSTPLAAASPSRTTFEGASPASSLAITASAVSPNAQASIHRHHMTSSPSLEDLRGGQAFKFKRDHLPAATRHSHDRSTSGSVLNSDNESVDGGRTSTSSTSSQIARGSYFHSGMQFLLALVDIATRLLIVPKPARLSALRAELTLLNHNLPADICVPLWCHATLEKPSHHRVVRLPPQDAVVLNSADRVPYLLLVEVLETDMSVEEIRAQRRDLVEVVNDAEATSLKTKEAQLEKDGTIKIEPAAVIASPLAEKDNTVSLIAEESPESEVKDSTMTTSEATTTISSSTTTIPKTALGVDTESLTGGQARPPIGSLADLSISPPGSPLPTSPGFDATARSKSPNAGNGGGGSISRQPTHSRSNQAYLQTVLKRRASNSADDFAEKMRTAAVMLAQLNQQQSQTAVTPSSGPRASTGSRASVKAKVNSVEDIRARIIKEMMALEEQRMQRMKVEGVSSGVGGGAGEDAGGEKLEDEQKIMANVTTDDPSAAVFSEGWEEKMNRIRQASPYGHLPSWQLLSVIVKQGADLRQEQLACQLIREMGWIWERAKIDVWTTNMRILITSDNSGLIETVRNTISIHSIKKDAYARRLNQVGMVFTLYDYFVKKFGSPASHKFIKAQDNFTRSLAAYSVITYVLQIRDRHNGNILVDNEGHIVHIDFGFMLSNSPGSVGFELAPFKLPQEYLDVLGGVNSEKFGEFKVLFKKAFMAVRKHTENIVLLIDMMSKDSKLPCFQPGDNAAQAVRDRLVLNLTEPQAEEFAEKLIVSSCCNIFTRLYDSFQYQVQGVCN